jgi:DNA modification methylase
MLVSEEVKFNKNDIETISKNIETTKATISGGDNLKNIKNIVKRELHSKLTVDGIDISIDSIVERNDAITFLRSLGTGSVNLVVTDPPYGVEFKASRNVGNESFSDGEVETMELLEATCRELVRVCSKNSHLYFFSGYSHLHKFQEIIGKYFFIQENPLIWVKNNHTMCDFQHRYANKYEFIIFASNGRRPLNNNISVDVLEYDKPTGKIHDCEKSIPLLEYLIKNSSLPGEVVCDPFAGSLSTYKACINTGRKCYTCEKDETIFKISMNSL